MGVPSSPLHKKTTLGLDLQGGLEVTLKAVPPKGKTLTSTDLDRSVSIIRDRIDKLGVSEPNVTKQGNNQIAIQLPGVKNPEAAAKVIGSTAQLDGTKLKGFDGGLPDSKMPGCERTLFNVIGFQPPHDGGGAVTSPVGADASELAAIKISEGFNLGYCKAKPGHGPEMHNHDTNETFIPMTGTWRASWENEKGVVEYVDHTASSAGRP